MKKIIIIFALIFIPLSASAHQPRIVDDNFNWVSDPEISQAFYGELEGREDYYLFKEEDPFYLYVNILVPDIKGAEKDFFFEVEKDGEMIYSSLTSSVSWEYFYEHFAGDGYYMGPEFEKDAESGEYTIKVSSPDKEGKYVLAIGKIESFPLDETINTIKVLPTLKKDFFEKSIFTAYYNYIGLGMLMVVILFTIIIVIIIFVLKRLLKRKKEVIRKQKK